MLAAGDTFLAPKRSDQTEHLYIVLSAPDKDGKALCVNVTTLRPYHEKTVVLKQGDHPFVQHDSVALYLDMKERDVAAVWQLIQTQTTQFVCKQHKSCTAALLLRLRQGMLDSPNVEKIIKTKYAALWGLKYP